MAPRGRGNFWGGAFFRSALRFHSPFSQLLSPIPQSFKATSPNACPVSEPARNRAGEHGACSADKRGTVSACRSPIPQTLSAAPGTGRGSPIPKPWRLESGIGQLPVRCLMAPRKLGANMAKERFWKESDLPQSLPALSKGSADQLHPVCRLDPYALEGEYRRIHRYGVAGLKGIPEGDAQQSYGHRTGRLCSGKTALPKPEQGEANGTAATGGKATPKTPPKKDTGFSLPWKAVTFPAS